MCEKVFKVKLAFFKAVLLAVAFAVIPANAFTMDVQGGITNHVSELSKFNMSFYGHWWFPIDKMTFVGVGGGYEELDNIGYVPLSASLWVRLPIGRQVLPVAIGDFGYMIGERHQMFWRAGGGLDIKNGDYSSILLTAGYQYLHHDGHGFVYLHAGILVEI